LGILSCDQAARSPVRLDTLASELEEAEGSLKNISFSGLANESLTQSVVALYRYFGLGMTIGDDLSWAGRETANAVEPFEAAI